MTFLERAAIRGMALGAHIVNLEVLDADGAGYGAGVVEAIDRAARHRRAFHPRVINLSLGP